MTLYIGDGLAQKLLADPVGRGDTYNLAMDQALWVLQNVLSVFNTPDEQARVVEAFRRWARRPQDHLYRHLNPVLAELKIEAEG